MIEAMLGKVQFRSRPDFIKNYERLTVAAQGEIHEQVKRIHGGPPTGPAHGGIAAREEAQQTLIDNGVLVDTPKGSIDVASPKKGS